MEKFLDTVERPVKPRSNGLTMVLDKGLPFVVAEGILENAAAYIDFVKLGWGTAYVSQDLRRKVELYRKYDVTVYLGGTFFEICYAQNKLQEYLHFIQDLGLTCVEVSDGAIAIPRAEKSRCIEFFGKNLRVLSEVGSKDASVVSSPHEWIDEIKADLAAGAWKVITESRESGNVGIYFSNEGVRLNLLEEICNHVEKDSLFFEVPKKSQQVYFINMFGPHVNLANVAPEEIIGLETLRLGLRADTIHLTCGRK